MLVSRGEFLASDFTKTSDIVVEDAVVMEDVIIESAELVELQAKYLKETGKEVPARYKNNIEWITSKI